MTTARSCKKLTSCMAYPAAIMPKPKRLAKRMFNRAGTFLSHKKMEGRACESEKGAWPSDKKAGSLEPAY